MTDTNMQSAEIISCELEFVSRNSSAQNRRPIEVPTSERSSPRTYSTYRHARSGGKAHTFRHIAIAACVCILAIALCVADLPVLNEVRRVLSGNMEIDDSLGQIKLVDSVVPKLTEVLSGGLIVKRDLFMPAQGKITKQFEKGATDGIEISCDEGASVYACDSGTVTAVKLDYVSGHTIEIKHSSGDVSIYKGCGLITVSEGEQVSRQSLLGSVITVSGESKLFFSYLHKGSPIDPLALVKS